MDSNGTSEVVAQLDALRKQVVELQKSLNTATWVLVWIAAMVSGWLWHVW